MFPKAINQLFTGVYFLELSLIGLFFLVRNAKGEVACVPQAIIMIVMALFTLIYQIMLNLNYVSILRSRSHTLYLRPVVRLVPIHATHTRG